MIQTNNLNWMLFKDCHIFVIFVFVLLLDRTWFGNCNTITRTNCMVRYSGVQKMFYNLISSGSYQLVVNCVTDEQQTCMCQNILKVSYT